MLDSNKAAKLAEWFSYAERYNSRDLVINNKVTDPVFSIGYVENQDSPPSLPTNKRFGKIVMFDYLPTAEFHPFLAMTEKSNSEKLNRSKVVMGQNVYHESITSALQGRGVRVGGVNQNDYLITLTYHLIPTDDEFITMFQSRGMVSGGVEEAITKYWQERYGIMTEEELDAKISDLLAKNDKIVTRTGLKAKMHELASQNF